MTAERNREIADLRNEGATMPQIGKRYGISKQRVGQILDRQKQITVSPLGRRTFLATPLGMADSEHCVVYALRMPRYGDRLRMLDGSTKQALETIDTHRNAQGIRHIVRYG